MSIIVPTPAEQGVQTVGAIPVARKADSPFQNLTPPDQSASGRLLEKVAGQATTGILGLAKADQARRLKNEKRSLLQFEVEAEALRQELLFDPINGLASKKGQGALDLINGTVDGFIGAGGAPTDGIAGLYKERMAALRSSTGADMSAAGLQALDIKATSLTNSFNATVNQAEIKEQALIDADLTANRVSMAAEVAAQSVGQSTEVVAKALAQALVEAESAVTDKHIGMADLQGISDKGLIEKLVKKQQGIVTAHVINTMISMGYLRNAITLLDKETKPGGSLHGRPEAVALNAAVLTTRQSDRGKVLFAEVESQHPGNVTLQLGSILDISNATDQALALSEWKAHNALANIVKRDQISKETLALVTFMQQNPGVPIDAKQYPALAQYNPRVIFEAGSRLRGVATGVRVDEATAAHVAAGGSAVGSDIVMNTLSNLAKKDPAAFIKLMENPKNIKSFTNVSQWVQLQAKEITAKKAEMDAVTKPMQYDSVLKDLGFKDSDSRYKNLIQNPDLHKALTEARRRIFEQTGKGATIEDLTPIIAKFALPVDESRTTNPTLYHLSEYSKAGTVDSKTMLDTPLDLDKDRDLVPLHYALDRKATAKEIRDIVDSFGPYVTLRMIAEHADFKVRGGVEVLKLGQWEQDRVDFHNAVLGMGFPPDFMADMLDIMNNRQGLPHTEKNASALARQFLLQPEVYKERFKTWASGGKL